MAICPSCSAELPATAKFCLSCGQALDPTALPTMTSPASGGSARAASDSDSFDHGRFAPGTMLGDRYRIVGRLGMGGMGEVYRADDLALGQPVALKFLPEAVERDPARLEKLTTEIRTARQVSHPNVCRVYDLGEVDGRRFLTMEYVDGEDLRSLLRRIGRLPEDKGLEIARQVCAGLAAIHDRGVLHRDLKPANVMLDGRGRVRLTDFGLATAVTGAGVDGEVAGTPAYMAPEQLVGQPLSGATDLYALGLVLFELFTGERVQTGETADAIRHAQQTVQSTLTTSGSGAKLDPMVQRVIARCLDPEPSRRPQSAIVVAAALPGGDPLAAALAAGETPSPQMVAAAGAEGGLSFAVAVPLLLVLIIGFVSMTWIDSRRSYFAAVPWPDSPEILAGKASEMLERLGYTEPVADSASGFRSNFDYGAWLDEHDTSATRWEHVASVRPPMMRFWHRTSPRVMHPEQFFGGSGTGGLEVGPADPPMTLPGMTYLELDGEGRLVALDVITPDTVEPAESAGAPDWPAFFLEAALDIDAFTPTEPAWVSRVAADAAMAWTGPGADATGAELRVEAAAFRGRPVFFRLIGPWTRPVQVVPTARTAAQVLNTVLSLTILLGVPAVAVALSLRNLRRGRTDVRGATRIAVAVGGTTLLAGVLSTRLVLAEPPLLEIFMLVSWAGFAALLMWTFYAALEPYARRHWPQMLISWSRLLDGRWRDRLVGRDLLVGAVLGVGLLLLGELSTAAEQWRGAPPTLSTGSLFPLTGGSLESLAAGLHQMTQTMWLALGLVMLLVLFRLVLRREWAAAAAFVILFVGPGVAFARDPIVTIGFEVVLSGIWVLVATRFGLVTFATMLFVFLGTNLGMVAPAAFARDGLVLVMVVMLAPGVFGFYTATRGRSASAWLDA